VEPQGLDRRRDVDQVLDVELHRCWRVKESQTLKARPFLRRKGTFISKEAA
jgi:hypothetical protein